MRKADTPPPSIQAAAEQAAAASAQRTELKLGYGYCGWLQSDPASARIALWRLVDDTLTCLTPSQMSVRSRVHEYGGGCWAPDRSGAWFVNDADQGIYLQPWNGGAPLLWWRRTNCRYGDLVLDSANQRLLAIEEDHSCQTVINRLVAIDLSRCHRQVLAEGADFYAAPAPSPCGRWLAWISWDHPFQPWTGTRLYRASVSPEGNLGEPLCLVDGCLSERPEAVQQPRFSPADELWMISDRSGWWNLYRYAPAKQSWLPVLNKSADFAAAPWQLGGTTYAFMDDRQLVCSYLEQGRACWCILLLLPDQSVEVIPFADADQTDAHRASHGWAELTSISSGGDRCVALAADERASGTLLCAKAGEFPYPLVQGFDAGAPPVAPRHCAIATEQGATLFAFYFAPANNSGRLIVQLHGGPTAYRSYAADSQRRFWLEQGYGVMEVNYRGSSGYGTQYRRLLQEQWGVLDAEDACAAGAFAIQQGWAQSGGLAVRGNSSGGYTVLRALQRADNPFNAAGCHYGIGDLQRLARLTHKFESRYLDWLIGDPQADKERYLHRSPSLSGPEIHTPVICFQGAEDRVVPAEQTRILHEKLQAKGIVSEYVEFAGEGHGFRLAENRATVLVREWAFYERLLYPA